MRQRQVIVVEYGARNRHLQRDLAHPGGGGARRCEDRAVIGVTTLSRSKSRDSYDPGRAEEAAVRNAGDAQHILLTALCRSCVDRSGR